MHKHAKPTTWGHTSPVANIANYHGVPDWVAFAYADGYIHRRYTETTNAAWRWAKANPHGFGNFLTDLQGYCAEFSRARQNRVTA